VQPEDIIDQVEINDGGSPVRYVTSRTETREAREEDLDPDRLAFQLSQWAQRQSDAKEVTLTVLRKNPPPNHNERKQVKLTLRWDDSWKYNLEGAIGPNSPLSIPGLGIAFRVETTVAGVTPGSPADQAGIRKGDVIKACRPQIQAKKTEDE